MLMEDDTSSKNFIIYQKDSFNLVGSTNHSDTISNQITLIICGLDETDKNELKRKLINQNQLLTDSNLNVHQIYNKIRPHCAKLIIKNQIKSKIIAEPYVRIGLNKLKVSIYSPLHTRLKFSSLEHNENECTLLIVRCCKCSLAHKTNDFKVKYIHVRIV